MGDNSHHEHNSERDFSNLNWNVDSEWDRDKDRMGLELEGSGEGSKGVVGAFLLGALAIFTVAYLAYTILQGIAFLTKKMVGGKYSEKMQ